MLIVSSFTHLVTAQGVFVDVNNQYKSAVDYLVVKEITKGTSATEFGTNQNIKRGDAAVFIAKALGLNAQNAPNQGFIDLNSRVEGYVNAIVEAKIAGGKTRTTFDPGANITRQEMAKMLANAYQLKATSNAGFTDVGKNWIGYVAALKDHGITLGKSPTKFAPTESLTRGEFALFIYRAEKGPTVEPTPQPPYTQRMNDIKTKWNSLKPVHTGAVLEVRNTVTAPYQLGKVHNRELTDALNSTNFARYLAYLPGNVKMNASYNQEAQAASLVNAVNQQISHNPKQPKGMNKAMYDLGFLGASTSNIGIGYSSIVESIQVGYMPDESNANRASVGHRRWILSPRLREVGFGFATDTNGRGHTAMKVVAPDMWDNPSATYDMIAWPSKTAFPTNFFGGKDPWSVSLNDDIYDASKTNHVTVQLTRVKDGKKWTFSRAKADGYFNINKETIGHTPYTIIFQPNDIDKYRQDEQYKVQISNVYKKNGQQTTVQFETTFFDL